MNTLLLINTFFHNLFLHARCYFHISSKSYYLLLINSFSYFIFLIKTFPPHFGWLMLSSFSSIFFYLVLLSFSLASIHLFHPTHGIFCFMLCYLSWVYTFSIMFIPHCKYFFLCSCTGSQCCKYMLTEPPAPKIHVHTPSTANAFWGHHIEN